MYRAQRSIGPGEGLVTWATLPRASMAPSCLVYDVKRWSFEATSPVLEQYLAQGAQVGGEAGQYLVYGVMWPRGRVEGKLGLGPCQASAAGRGVERAEKTWRRMERNELGTLGMKRAEVLPQRGRGACLNLVTNTTVLCVSVGWHQQPGLHAAGCSLPWHTAANQAVVCGLKNSLRLMYLGSYMYCRCV